MPAWNDTLSLTEPLGWDTLADSVDTLITAADATLTVAQAGLDAASAFLSGPLAPEAAAAQALIDSAQSMISDVFEKWRYKRIIGVGTTR